MKAMRRPLLLLLILPASLSCVGGADPPIHATASRQEEPQVGQAVYVGDELLKGYRPVPALVTKETIIERAKFPVIDIHCHWSARVEPEALLAAMDERNVVYAVNLSGGSGGRLEQTLARFDPSKHPRLITFVNIDYSGIDRPDFGQEVRASLADAKARGVKGVKIAKNLGLTVKDGSGKLVPIDDPRLDPMWAAAGELGLPVLVHSADPAAFFEPVDEKNERWLQLKRHPDWSFYGPEYPKREEILAQFDRVVEKHPGTTFIAAHLGNWAEDLSQLAARFEKYPNLYADISAREAEWGRQPYTARKFFIQYADRLLFGTDRYPGRTDQPRYRVYYRILETDDEYFDYYEHDYPPTGEWKVYGLFLPDDVLKKIYHDNAARLLGLPAL